MRLLRVGPLAAGASIALYLALATANLESPGLEYDEVLFGNAALGVKDHSFVAWAFSLGSKNVALMLMPYIGALKAYLYYPVFQLLGAGPAAVRLPVVLAGAVALALYFLATRRIAGRGVALLMALLLATDPSFLYHIRLDWGPVALMLLLKAAGVYLFLRWWDTRGPWPLALSGLCLGLGIWDKVNFVWFPLAAGLAAAVVYRRELWGRATPGSAALFLGSLVLGALPLLLYNVAFPLVTVREPFEGAGGLAGTGLERRWKAMAETLLGVAVFRFVNAEDLQALWSLYLPGVASDGVNPIAPLAEAFTSTPFGRGSLLAVAFPLAVVYLVARLRSMPRPQARAAAAVMLAALLVVVQIVATRKATGSYHAVVLYPLPHLLVAMAAAHLAGWWAARRPPARGLPAGRLPAQGAAVRRAAVAAALVAVIASALLVDAGYLRYFATEGGRGIWSSAIYDLADFARARPSSRLVLMDWGFNTQLLTLSRGEIHKDEVYHWLTPGQAERERFDAYLRDPESLFVFHAAGFTKFPAPRQVFLGLLEAKGLAEEVVQVFPQGNGEEVYFVSRAVPSPIRVTWPAGR